MLKNKMRHLHYIGYAVGAILIVCASAAWIIKNEREKNFRHHEDLAQQFAQIFERHSLQVFSYADAYVRMARTKYLETKSPDALKEAFRAIPIDQNIVSHVTVIDEHGTPVFNSGYELRPGVNVSDRGYFKEMKAATGDVVFFSLPKKGRNSDKLIMRQVRRMEYPDGRFAGVIFAALDTSNVTSFFEALELGMKSTATLVGMDKRIRARANHGNFGPGQDISDSRLWEELAVKDIGLYQQRSIVDGVERYYAYRKLQNYPLVVAIGVALEDIRDKSIRFELSVIMIATLITAIIIIMAFMQSREVSRITSSFLANMSHELRTPLNAIVGFAQMMETRVFGPLGDKHYEDYSRHIIDSSRHLLSVINDLLDLSKIEAGKMVLDESDVDVVRAAQFAVEVSLGMARKGETKIDFDPPGSFPLVRGDERLIRQILINLVSNAVKFSEDDGRVEVKLGKTDDGDIEIVIIDEGIGMSKKEIRRAMKPFNQVFDPMIRDKHGTGLGLPLAQEMVQLHGGVLSLESEPGMGTTAKVQFPAARIVPSV